MEITISGFWLLAVMLLAVVIGYFIGRGDGKRITTEEQDVLEEECRKPGSGRKTSSIMSQGKIIASPVDGIVQDWCEGGRRGAVVLPRQGKLYAPISGKIVKLFPMGNAFLIQTEAGVELLVRVGRPQPDELCSMYFRSRVVPNEIVNKGKLLLEFDKDALEAVGEDTGVTVCPKDTMVDCEIRVTEKETVKVGEELLRICEIIPT